MFVWFLHILIALDIVYFSITLKHDNNKILYSFSFKLVSSPLFFYSYGTII